MVNLKIIFGACFGGFSCYTPRLTISKLSKSAPAQSYDFAELFCGQAWVSRCMRTAGHRTAMLDISLGRPNDDLKKQDAMDLLSDSGFAFFWVYIICDFS